VVYGVLVEQPQEASITAAQSKSLPMKFSRYKEVLNLFFCSAVMKALRLWRTEASRGWWGGFQWEGGLGNNEEGVCEGRVLIPHRS